MDISALLSWLVPTSTAVGAFGALFLTRRRDTASTQSQLVADALKLRDARDGEVQRQAERISALERGNKDKDDQIATLSQRLVLEQTANTQLRTEVNYLRQTYVILFEQNQRLAAQLNILQRRVSGLTGEPIPDLPGDVLAPPIPPAPAIPPQPDPPGGEQPT